MEVAASLQCPGSRDRLAAIVSDLSTYPKWLDIVANAEAEGADPTGVEAEGVEDDAPTWMVELRGQLGPLRRTKRLRMQRTLWSEDRIVFERRERDGRDHSQWILAGDLSEPAPGLVELNMTMTYGGSLWIPVLDRLLADEIRRSRDRLAALVTA